MAETESRLERCFQAVFPGLTPAQVAAASVDTVEDWDSMRALTLIEVLQEEFGLSFPDEDVEVLTSFSAIQTYLKAHVR
jgi:acyl carrier protein